MSRVESSVIRSCAILVMLLSLAGCASSNNGDALYPQMNGLSGTWEYLVTNAYDARFTNCTGDATVLEGATLFEGLSIAPICMTPVSFAVDQDGDAFEAPPHQVTCSDGATASVTAVGQIAAPVIGGQWDSVSDQGVTAEQIFSGSIVGNRIELSESQRTFSGTFQGSCEFSPALTALVTVL